MAHRGDGDLVGPAVLACLACLGLTVGVLSSTEELAQQIWGPATGWAHVPYLQHHRPWSSRIASAAYLWLPRPALWGGLAAGIVGSTLGLSGLPRPQARRALGLGVLGCGLAALIGIGASLCMLLGPLA